MRYTDTPEVLKLAAGLEALPSWYLALMLARVLNRKAPDVADESRPEREVATHGDGGGWVHLRDLFNAERIC